MGTRRSYGLFSSILAPKQNFVGKSRPLSSIKIFQIKINKITDLVSIKLDESMWGLEKVW